MGCRDTFKEANPQFDRINRGLPMDIHHVEQQCLGGSDGLDNLAPMLSGRHEKHVHSKSDGVRDLDFEDYLFEF